MEPPYRTDEEWIQRMVFILNTEAMAIGNSLMNINELPAGAETLSPTMPWETSAFLMLALRDLEEMLNNRIAPTISGYMQATATGNDATIATAVRAIFTLKNDLRRLHTWISEQVNMHEEHLSGDLILELTRTTLGPCPEPGEPTMLPRPGQNEQTTGPHRIGRRARS